MNIFKRAKAKSIKHEPTHRIISDEPSRNTMRTRERPASSTNSVRYAITDKPTFSEADVMCKSSGERHALTYVHYKLNAMHTTGAPMTDLYVWDFEAPSGTLNPVAQFRYNEANQEVWRV
jgi:hypothetical protein